MTKGIIEIDGIYFNPDKIAAISSDPKVPNRTFIWFGAQEDNWFAVNLPIKTVIKRLIDPSYIIRA